MRTKTQRDGGKRKKRMNDRLKNKNGSLQRDKLKMGIGKNERMMEAHRERERE